jgi:hypothetical protein
MDPAAERARIAKLIEVEKPRRLPAGALRLLVEILMDHVDRQERAS